MKREGVRARVLTVRMRVDEVGFFNALLDGAGRLGLARTRGRGDGTVDIIATPDTFEEVLEFVRGVRRYVRDLEILGESDLRDLNF